MTGFDAVDLFAGPGGWDEGARRVGLTTVGLEWDQAACVTAAKAGHARIRADVAAYPSAPFKGIPGLIASPPCTDFSTAGAMRRMAGDSGHLVQQVLRWVEELRPAWFVAEQVPAVLPIWQEYALRSRHLGYSVWVGILNAADYGVPQVRKRAILMGSRHRFASPPTPTHSAEVMEDLFGTTLQPWVTLAETCGLPVGCEYDSGQNSRAAGGGTVRYIRSCDRPSGTITGQTLSQWVIRGGNRRKLTTADGAALQSFPTDYPWHGSREEVEQQIGNAVPPTLAEHILAALTGAEMRAAA